MRSKRPGRKGSCFETLRGTDICERRTAKVRLTQEYDVFLVMFQMDHDFLDINAIDGWQDHCRTLVCWIGDMWAAHTCANIGFTPFSILIMCLCPAKTCAVN